MSEPGGGGGTAAQSQMRQVLDAFQRNANSLHGPSRLEEQIIGRAKFKLAGTGVDLSRVGPNHPIANGSYRKDVQEAVDLSKRQAWLLHQLQQQDRLRQQIHHDRPPIHLTGEKIRQIRETQKVTTEKLRLESKRRSKEETRPPDSGFKTGGGGATVPIMSSSDNSWSDLDETVINGERISCFVVGGEPRLCLPQFLNFVLAKVDLQAIKQACEELQIYCPTCSNQQLSILKKAEILPNTAYQCGLITKSDAERLCSYLLDRDPPRASIRMGDPKASPFSFRVEHDCFGRCEGLVLPEAYTQPDARCIECQQCGGLFSPRKFVTHAHDSAETRTCHWGFSSDNWRIYLRLSETYSDGDKERHSKVLDDFKLRFCSTNGGKRIKEGDHYDAVFSQTKRIKVEEAKSYAATSYPPVSHRPWSPSLKVRLPPGYPYPLEQQSPYKLEKCEEEKFTSLSSSSSSSYNRYKDSPYSVIPKKKYLEEHERFPTLADEISRIKTALDGAPVHAKEAVLKILERLTARVGRAEREKDDAMTKYRELQLKYGQLEDELAKKRGELRELLRQDLRPGLADPTPDGGGSSPLKLVKRCNDDGDVGGRDKSVPSSTECTVLPKISLKSPSKIMEDVPSSTRSEAGSLEREDEEEAQPSASSPNGSDSLKERMVKMEAELNKLREEVSNRGGKQDRTKSSPLPPTSLSYSSTKLGSNGANSSSPTPSPASHPESSPSADD